MKRFNVSSNTLFTAIILLAVLNFIITPMLGLIGLNCILSALAVPEIPYTFGSWLGAFLIKLFISSSVEVSAK